MPQSVFQVMRRFGWGKSQEMMPTVLLDLVPTSFPVGAFVIVETRSVYTHTFVVGTRSIDI